MKREPGAVAMAINSGAAPATVSGERRLNAPLGATPGRPAQALTRKPGDLPR